MRIRKIRKFLENNQRTDRQTDREQFKNLGHSNPLWIVGGAGQYCVILKYTMLYNNVLC